MPERTFDGARLRERRVVLRKSQTSLAQELSVTTNQVSKWEIKQATPPQDRLPAIARAVEADLDELFPRNGLPTLADLRCDAGMTRADTMACTQTKSFMAVRAAEEGKRPLSREHEEALAEAYGVTLVELRAAQKRSFGHQVPVVAPTQTPAAANSLVTDRLAYLRDEVYGGSLPSDVDIVAAGNLRSKQPLLTEDVVRSLREGAPDPVPDEVVDALALALGLLPLYFRTHDPQIARLVALARAVQERYAAQDVRSGEGGMPREMRLQLTEFINSTILGPDAGREAK